MTSEARRRSPDRTERRHFVYSLRDAAGDVLYVGRSCDVARRLKSHLREASNPDIMQAPRKALWFMDVRDVDMTGPYTWGEAVAEERRQIEDLQPHGNIALTDRDPARLPTRAGVRRLS